jgi:hypothetical protein
MARGSHSEREEPRAMARGSHSDEAKLQTAFSDCIVSATRNYARQAFALMRSNKRV